MLEHVTSSGNQSPEWSSRSCREVEKMSKITRQIDGENDEILYSDADLEEEENDKKGENAFD